jgi:hypothetical protein
VAKTARVAARLYAAAKSAARAHSFSLLQSTRR